MGKVKITHPVQPLLKDKYGGLRFKKNEIVRFLLDSYTPTLNALATMDFSREDWEQFYQLIGYSVGGYCELSRVSNKSKDAAWSAAGYDKD